MRQLETLAADRILLLDGAMGTMLLSEGFSGSLDQVVLTDAAAVGRVHRAYLDAGSDIITTNTFTSTAYAVNRAAAHLARGHCDKATAHSPDKPRFLAGSIGPVGRFENYREQVSGLLDGGCDLLLVETATSSATTLEALRAIDHLAHERQRRWPVMISAAISVSTGRLFSGETIEDFWHLVAGARPWSVGLNCSSGARDLAQHLGVLARVATCRLSVHPSAGLPDAVGTYPETPEYHAAIASELALGDLLNIAGGCCGTTPKHIAAVARAVASMRPHRV